MIRIGTVNGDVIENGAVKTVNHYHYYGEKIPVGQDDTGGDLHLSAQETGESHSGLPEQLCTPIARGLLDKLHAAGIVNSQWQPIGLTGAEKSVLAADVADRLYIHNHWAFFGKLWNVDKETLRQANVKGMSQESTGSFLDRLKKALS